MALPRDARRTIKKIVLACVAGNKLKLGLKGPECYQSIDAVYVDGQAKRVVQVIPAGIRPYGGGQGGQTGGFQFRKLMIQHTVWWRLKLDRHKRSEQVLTKESDGLLDFFESLREIYDMTVLGGLLTERMTYEGETAGNWFDVNKGVVRRDLTLGAVFACELPTVVTLGAEDLQDVLAC